MSYFRKIILPSLLLLLVTGYLYWLLYWRYFQTTDNAYTRNDITHISARINGQLMYSFIQDNHKVSRGSCWLSLTIAPVKIVFDTPVTLTAALSWAVLNPAGSWPPPGLNIASLRIQSLDKTGQSAVVACFNQPPCLSGTRARICCSASFV